MPRRLCVQFGDRIPPIVNEAEDQLDWTCHCEEVTTDAADRRHKKVDVNAVEQPFSI